MKSDSREHFLSEIIEGQDRIIALPHQSHHTNIRVTSVLQAYCYNTK